MTTNYKIVLALTIVLVVFLSLFIYFSVLVQQEGSENNLIANPDSIEFKGPTSLPHANGPTKAIP